MRRVREWICLVLFRLLYPLSLLTCSLVRINGFSMVYGALALVSALVRRPTPSSISKSTGSFLCFSVVFCGATFLAQSIFQIYNAAVADDPMLENCSFLENILRQLGLQRLGTSSAANATRLVLPDVAAFLVSVFVYTTSKTLLQNEPTILGTASESVSRSRLSKLMSQMVIFLGPGAVLVLMAFCGISAPSVVGAVYFLCFLTAITLWASGVRLSRWFSIMKGALLIYNILHLAATYLTQMPFAQELWDQRFYDGHYDPNSTVLAERILGLRRLVYTNCSAPWEVNFYDNLATDYLNVAVLVVFFFVTGIEIRSTGEEDSLRSHPSPTRNYNTIESVDEQPIRNEDWLSRRSSSVGSQVKESSRRFEAFKAVAVSVAQFVLGQSYVATLIVMMTWSITYHSWLAMVFLLAACLIWMVPQKRKLCLKLSPLIVFYAECLLVISYVYGFDLTERELPTHTKEGYDLSEIGFYKDRYPFVRLVVQVAFLLVFLFTLKYSQLSGTDKVDGTSLETLNALRRASIQATIQYNEIMSRFGNWVMSFLIKYWILVCSLLFLIMALQDAVVYRILYMVMFLCFIISFQMSYSFWRIWEKLFWVVVIIYSMVILLAIYILQFKDVMEKVHNSTGMSYDLMRDIGFEKYGTKDLFVNLLTPTSFLIVIILHLHYFQTKFLAISDLERYRNSPSSSSPTQPESPEQNVLSGATWKETLLSLASFVHRHYRKLVVLIWRVLEVHMFKVVAMTIFTVCAVDVCCLNVLLVVAVLVLLPLGFNRVLSFIAMFFSSFIIVSRMVYQLNLINEQYFISNCTNFPNVTDVMDVSFPLAQVNGTKYFGYKKSDSMFMEVRVYIILVLLLAFEKIVSLHQEQHFNHPGHSRPKQGTIFMGISRARADADLLSCFKFLANYGFYKFGKEISLLSIVIVMVARMDVLSLVHGFFLGLLFLLRRGVCRVIWPGYLTILIVLLFVQYLSCLGLPPVLCIDYPWNLPPMSGFFPRNLKIFLFLPDYVVPPYSVKLIADFFQVLLVCLQLRVFRQEQKPEVVAEGGSNESIISEVLEGRNNPTEDFVLFKDSYLDYLKIGIFYYSFWMTLLLLFISGTSRISVFCLGYLVGCFYFLWYGQDLLLKPINNLNRIWSCMLLYCYAVLMVKCALQIFGCVYNNLLPCIAMQCLDVMCLPIYPYDPPLTLGVSKEESCELSTNQTSLVWDCISFYSIYFLLRAYKSWYFQHVVNELRVDNELASRGSELINEMTSKRVDTQKRFEVNVLDSIRLKVEKIRNQMQMQQSQAKSTVPFTDHYEVIRSGDYYMFDDMNSDATSTEVKDDDCAGAQETVRKDPKPPTVAELFNTASVSGMEAAIAMWTDWQQRYGPGSIPGEGDESAPSPGLPDDRQGEEADEGGENEEGEEEEPALDDATSETSPLLKKLKTFLKFVGIVCLSSVEQLIVFLSGISRDYVCISNNLKQEKLKRRKATLMRTQTEEPALIELELEIPPTPAPPAETTDKSSTDPMLEESRFRKKMPLLLKLMYAMFEVFLSHSELLCYFAMILNAIVYGSILSMAFPTAAFLWATLTCPRPTKAFWLFAIGYTEALIIFKYVFQFFNFDQSSEPKNVFYWASVLGVTKEDFYAAFDIFLLMCLFFHRSVLKQHGLWRDAETSNGKHHVSGPPEVKPAELPDKDEAVTDEPERSSSSPTSTLRKRKVKKDPDQADDASKVDDDDDDKNGDGRDRDSDEEKHDGDTKKNDGDDVHPEVAANEVVEYREDFESEMSRICCNNFLVQPMVEYFKQLKDGTFRAATDVYVFMFLADIVTFLIAIFGFSSFGPADPSISGVMVTAVLKKNKIPSVLLGMLLVQFLFIIIDRAIYLRKQVIFKLIFQIFLVLLIHAWVFFGLPYITQKRFVENTTVQLWYFTKCIYLALSAYQVRCGYPTCILGNFLTKKYNYINLYCFQLFLVIPFLHELRSLMDWMFTDTTLALTSWLQMEDIYSNVFCVKCNRSAEKRYKTPRGNKRAAIVKYGLGGAMLFLLIFIIWLPLLLFSMSNSIFEPNKPAEVAVTIKLAGYQKIYSMSTRQLTQLTKSDFDYVYSNYPAVTRSFLSSYQENDCFNVSLKGESEGMWTISPPATRDIVKSLYEDETVVVQFVISFRRNPTISSEVASAQFERPLTKADMTIRLELADLITGNYSSKIVNITSVFPRHLVVPASGSVLSADNYFPPRDENYASGYLSGNLEFELNSDGRSTSGKWWSVKEFQANKTSEPEKSFNLTTFNERVAPSGVLSVLNNYGVYGLYLSFVLVISRFLRMYIQGLSYKIMYVELPDPQALLTLCQDIYMVRESREFRLEEELFAQLIFLYRSPETLFKVTKQKSE